MNARYEVSEYLSNDSTPITWADLQDLAACWDLGDLRETADARIVAAAPDLARDLLDARAQIARLESVCGDLAVMAGAAPDPEEDPEAGLSEAWVLLLCAQVLVEAADRMAAPALNCDGVLTSRWEDVLDELRDFGQRRREE